MRRDALFERRRMLLKRLKSTVKAKALWLVPVYSFLHLNLIERPRARRMTVEERFTEIFVTNGWRSAQSTSGDGSTIESTSVLRAALPIIVRQLSIRSMLDIPCGDFNWMRTLELDLDTYLGADIVETLVETNTKRYESSGVSFAKIDITEDPLPKVDFILCRDCLIHFSLKDAVKALTNIKASGSKYVALTTFDRRSENTDIVTGEFSPVNMRLKPFSLPPAHLLVDEQYRDAQYRDKRLGIWKVSDVPQLFRHLQ